MQGEDGNSLDNDLFFKNEDADSLRVLISRYIDGKIDEEAVRKRVNHLKSLHSWQSAAKATIEVYKGA